jgi:hypothetical protein
MSSYGEYVGMRVVFGYAFVQEVLIRTFGPVDSPHTMSEYRNNEDVDEEGHKERD